MPAEMGLQRCASLLPVLVRLACVDDAAPPRVQHPRQRSLGGVEGRVQDDSHDLDRVDGAAGNHNKESGTCGNVPSSRTAAQAAWAAAHRIPLFLGKLVHRCHVLDAGTGGEESRKDA